MTLRTKHHVRAFLLLIAFAVLALLPVVCHGQVSTTGKDPVTIERSTLRLQSSLKVPTGKAITIESGGTFTLSGAFDASAATNKSTVRSDFGLAIGTDVQAYDADLTTLGAGGSGARSFLGLAIGTDVQAYDADLTTLGAGGGGARSFLGLAIGTDVQAYDADLTTLGAGGINARSFLGLTPSTSAAVVYVSKSSAATDTRTSLAATDPNVPFATVGAALTAAKALSPTVTAPVLISIGPGTFSESAIGWDTAYIHARGAGMRQTVLNIGSASAVTLSAAHIGLADLTIARAASGNAAKVLHTQTAAGSDTMTLAAWLDDIRLDNVRVSNTNTSGVAVGTLTAIAHGCVFEGTTKAIDWAYGCDVHDSIIIGGQYGVYQSQSVSRQYESPPQNVHQAMFEGCYISSTDTTGGWGIYGLIESAFGTRTGTDADGQVVTPGTTAVSWYPTFVSGGNIKGAAVSAVTGTAATSPCFLGCIHTKAVNIYGDVVTTYLFDSYHAGDYITSQRNTTTALMTNLSNTTFTSCNIIFSGTTTSQMSYANFTKFVSCYFEGDAELYASGIQPAMIGCTDSYGPLGWQIPYLALRIKSTGAVPRVADSLTYSGNNAMTIEGWFKVAPFNLASTSEDLGFFSITKSDGTRLAYVAGARAGSGSAETQASRSVYAAVRSTAIVYTSSSNPVMNYSVTDPTGQSTTQNNLNGPFGDGWHHIALVLSAGSVGSQTVTLYVDGTSVGTPATNGDEVGAAETAHIVVGGISDGADSTVAYHCNGMCSQFRVSNVARTISTTTLSRSFYPDANTLLLLGSQTRKPGSWTDLMGKRDATFINQAVPSGWGRWVRDTRAAD